MDLTDAKILRLMQWNPMNPVDRARGPYGIWDVARNMELHGNSVKRRIQTLFDDGTLLGFSLFPDAGTMGLQAAFVAFRFSNDPDCDRATDQVFAQGPPGEAMRTADRELRFNMVVHQGESLEDAARDQCMEFGADSFQIITARNWGAEAPTDLELRVLQQMHRNVMASPPEIAVAVGVTAKTVRKCVTRLREKATFCLCPLIDYSKASGLVTSIIEVEIDPGSAAMNDIFHGFPDLISEGVWTGPVHTFSLFTENQQDVGHVMAEMRTIQGVRDVRMIVPLRMHFQPLPQGLRGLGALASDPLAAISATT